MNLFAEAEQRQLEQAMPLPARMRPRTLDEIVGQDAILAPESYLRRALRAGQLGSIILTGPPGCGKTTLARLLAEPAHCEFHQLNALSTGVKEIRDVMDRSHDAIASGGRRTLLFIDELHRLNRGQQEVLLREIEEGIIAFVGATTANPFFAVSSALISRSHVLELTPLSVDDLAVLLTRANEDSVRGLGQVHAIVEPETIRLIAVLSNGDARSALRILELAVMLAEGSPPTVTPQIVRQAVQRRAGTFDRSGDEHYDLASALIKSVRGSDPDAGIYWLARMLEAGEDVRFLCRRLVILASEDIGNADPQALVVATAAMQACEFVGLPECQFALAQTVTYLACAPKSNAATAAIGAARADVRNNALIPVPMYLRDAHSTSAAMQGRGQGYRSAHESETGVIAQDYLGVDREYYRPLPHGFEAELAKRLEVIREQLRADRPTGADELPRPAN